MRYAPTLAIPELEFPKIAPETAGETAGETRVAGGSAGGIAAETACSSEEQRNGSLRSDSTGTPPSIPSFLAGVTHAEAPFATSTVLTTPSKCYVWSDS